MGRFMVELLLKYITIIFCSFYTYVKLLNLKIKMKSIVIDLALALALSISILLIRLLIQPLSIPIMIVLFLGFITLVTSTKLEISITTTILSFGINYAFSYISALLVAILSKLIQLVYSSENFYIFSICVSFIQILLTILLFRIKRLKKGMPFLLSKGASNIGVFTSVVLLSCVILFFNHNNADLVYLFPVVFIFLCGIFVLFWWRDKLTKTYMERLRADEIHSLQAAIQSQREEIHNLREHNEMLANIIHKDNKLIPAMELAVSEYLQSLERESPDNHKNTGRELLAQLKNMAGERSGIIREYESDHKKLPATDVFAIDSLMTHMRSRARENDIEFGLVLYGSVKYMTENIIPVSDLRALLADLIENAVIAAKSSANREILVSIGVSESCYLIGILDSGVPFEPDTLVHLGLQKTTTHAEHGGSGIGLVTAFEILKHYRASLIIEEFSDESTPYSKRVSVKFDGLNQYIVKTMRHREITALSQRDDLIVLAE
jgi:signal transduction histidine kinase